MDRTQPVVPVLIPVLAALMAATPAIAQEPHVAAAPPDGAAVHRFTADRWEEPLCAGAREWTFVDDGWNTFARNTRTMWTVRLRAQD